MNTKNLWGRTMLTHKDGTLPENDMWIFVFGSNLSGIHGAGSAKVAHREYDRPYGTPVGHYISPVNLRESFAIPTKDRRIQPMTLDAIRPFVDEFCNFVEKYPTKLFFLTRIGCGLAGYSDEEVAPMFSRIKSRGNVSFPEQWKYWLLK